MMAIAAAFVLVGYGGNMIGMQDEIHAGLGLFRSVPGAGSVAAPAFAFQGA
jgi:hypothetical protein